MPAVSTRTNVRLPRTSTVSIESRVVPGTSETITRSSPSSAFRRLDLPTFGRPRIATRIASSPISCGPEPGSIVTTASSRSPVPWPCCAESGTGSPRPSRWNSNASASWSGSSILFASSSTGLWARRRIAASSSSPGVIPARASTTNSTRSASAIAARDCSTIERVIGVWSAISTPPVSISRKRLPFQSATTSLRSRVTPGVSCTTAARDSLSRLTSVDLPTFGKPTTATVPASSSATSRRLTRADQLFDLRDHVLDVEVGGVDLVRVLGWPHARCVALVAQAEVGCERVGANLGPLGQAAIRAHGTIGVQVDLHRSLRGDHGADVAALDHDVAIVGELLLARAHHLAHVLVARDDRDEAVDVGLANRGGDVRVGDPDAPLLVEADRRLGRELAELVAVAERHPALAREPRQRPVHRAGVEVAKAQPLGQAPGDRALAGSRRAVDGDDHRCVTESSSSKNPGKLTATASASSTWPPLRETSPATAPSMATRWSPCEAMRPPLGRAGTPLTQKPSSRGVTRTPIARSEFVTVSMRSVSFTRSSSAPQTVLSPRAQAAASAKSGSSEPGSSVAPTMNGSAAEKPPGTSTSPSRSRSAGPTVTRRCLRLTRTP